MGRVSSSDDQLAGPGPEPDGAAQAVPVAR